MTLKEKLETIKGKKIAIWCEEEWMARRLVKSYEGDNWSPTHWDEHANESCYDLEGKYYWFTHADKDYYLKLGYTVIKFNDFCEPTRIVLSKRDIDITYLLNEKYGKDNWVIR